MIKRRLKKAGNEFSKKELRAMIDSQNLPRHIAVIMDGNGRWAKKRMLPRVAGHRIGLESAIKIVRVASNLGVQVLTLYAFSAENWRRPPEEVGELMKLLVEYLRRELLDMQKNNVRFQAIGRISGLPGWVQEEIRWSTDQTKDNTGLLLNVALNYGSRLEIIDAVKGIVSDAQDNKIDIDNLDEETFSDYLYTKDVPDPDMLIRTSGEMRISNFLLWQLAYSELFIVPTLWPDFREKELLQAVIEYQKRERRFGTIGKIAQSK